MNSVCVWLPSAHSLPRLAPFGACAGRKPLKGQTVTIHCVGTLQTGNKEFWSTRDKYGKPYQFVCGIGKVIKVCDCLPFFFLKFDRVGFFLSFILCLFVLKLY